MSLEYWPRDDEFTLKRNDEKDTNDEKNTKEKDANEATNDWGIDKTSETPIARQVKWLLQKAEGLYARFGNDRLDGIKITKEFYDGAEIYNLEWVLNEVEGMLIEDIKIRIVYTANPESLRIAIRKNGNYDGSSIERDGNEVTFRANTNYGQWRKQSIQKYKMSIEEAIQAFKRVDMRLTEFSEVVNAHKKAQIDKYTQLEEKDKNGMGKLNEQLEEAYG